MKSLIITRKLHNCRLLSCGSHPQIIMSGNEAALIQLSHEQNVQMKSQRYLGVITGDTRQTRAYSTKASTAQALWPVRGKYSRASHRQRQTPVNLVAFMTGIPRFMKAYAVLWQKLYARFSEHTFDQGNRVLVSRVATHLDVRDCVSMKTGRLSQVPNCPIQCRPNLCTCHRQEMPLPHVTMSQPSLSSRQSKGGPSEPQIV
jgi:hypothetical protein